MRRGGGYKVVVEGIFNSISSRIHNIIKENEYNSYSFATLFCKPVIFNTKIVIDLGELIDSNIKDV